MAAGTGLAHHLPVPGGFHDGSHGPGAVVGAWSFRAKLRAGGQAATIQRSPELRSGTFHALSQAEASWPKDALEPGRAGVNTRSKLAAWQKKDDMQSLRQHKRHPTPLQHEVSDS